MYYGRCVEPLAFSLDSNSVHQQFQSPLFGTLPTEIRDTIYEYAFTDCTSNPMNADNPHRRSAHSNHTSFQAKPERKELPVCDVAVKFLETCKAVYLEAYKLPFLLNPFILYHFGALPSYDICRPRFLKLVPWQFALISHLDISLQQIALEGETLKKYLHVWRAKERSAGCVVAPRFYQETRNSYPGPIVQSFNFGLLSVLPCEDGVPVALQTKSSHFSQHQKRPNSVTSTARAMVARPLTRLTLRLSRTDWWTWADRPNEITVGQLGLDPAFGDGGSGENQRPVQPRMLQFARERQAGQFPNPYYKDPAPSKYEGTWGAEVGKLSDLKVLELVLETFEEKKSQLDTVIECAKTWKFPLEPKSSADPSEDHYELVWDGEIEEANWTCERQIAIERFGPPPISATRLGHIVPLNPSWGNGVTYLGEWQTQNPDVAVSIIRFRRQKVDRDYTMA